MELIGTVRIAVRALGRHKLRTFLTMLGMIIGVAAVMTMMALGSGAQASVEDEMKSAGTNLVYVSAGNYTRGGDDIKVASGLGASKTLVEADVDAIRLQVRVGGVQIVAAEVEAGVVVRLPPRLVGDSRPVLVFVLRVQHDLVGVAAEQGPPAVGHRA